MDWGPLRISKPEKWACTIGNMPELMHPVFDEESARQLQRKAGKETAQYDRTWRKQRMKTLIGRFLFSA